MSTEQHECTSAAAVAGLAREVESMRRAMRQVASQKEVKRLADLITELSETTTAAAISGGGVGEPEPPSRWLAWSGPAEAARGLMSDLTAWMGDVYLRYADAAAGLPECWLWHPEVVEELVWLMQAWLTAYVADSASVRLAADWHDRLRPGVVRRIKESYAKACSLDNHKGARVRPAPGVPVEDAAQAIAAWWADHRDRPAPEPTDEQVDAAVKAKRRDRGRTL